MSFGFSSTKSVVYSTLPLALRGAEREVLDDRVVAVGRVDLAGEGAR
jgi:hypothetical protein